MGRRGGDARPRGVLIRGTGGSTIGFEKMMPAYAKHALLTL